MAKPKKSRIPYNATLATQVEHLADAKQFVFSVWAKMRRKQHMVCLIVDSDPRCPDYAIYESMDDPDDPSDPNDYGPMMLMYLYSGKTHKHLSEDRWNAVEESIAGSGMYSHEVSALYGELADATERSD